MSQLRFSVCHVTTAHPADDVRIYEKECKTLASTGKYRVTLAAPAAQEYGLSIDAVSLPRKRDSRVARLIHGPLAAFRLTRRHSFDIWHFHDPELVPVAIALSLQGKTVIWDAHEDYQSQISSTGAKRYIPKPGRPLIRGAARLLLGLADRTVSAVVAATPTIANRYTASHTCVVGNEAVVGRFTDCKPLYESRQLLFIGSPTADHCFPQVIAAVESISDVHLLIAGRRLDASTWSEAKRRLGTRVRYAGWLDREGLALAINESAIGLVTYADSAAYNDDYISPTKLFEFAAAGLPVVGTPIRGNQRLIADSGSGVVAEGFNSKAIQVAIEKALQSKETWKEQSEAGRRWSAKYGSWTASEKRLTDLYERLTLEN